MSFMTRLWNAIRNPIRCVGRDLEGNRFYERPSPNELTRPIRSIQYRDPEDMWKYTGGGKRLPIQWSAWLAHTRPHPPTIQELQADIARQQRVRDNVALIEARDRAEDQERLRLRQEDTQIALRRALTDVSSSGEYPHQEQAGARSQDDSAHSTNARASDIRGGQKNGLESKVEEVPSPASNNGTLYPKNGPKIRPPAFLTPAKSPKSQSKTPISSSAFTAPSGTIGRLTQGGFGGEHQCQRKKAERESSDAAQSDSQAHKSADDASPLPVMPSRVTETESWTPKARARR
ncbi:hypothetical protein BYT27DRAFT_6958982 [Phlegmacium glaucopus]|nr:hypothetical protein BYT27DRAFT_6958982 [Phlegmacium glaucopus]